MIIKYFAWIKDITNKEIEELNETNCNNINELKNYLCTKYPTLRKHINSNRTHYIKRGALEPKNSDYYKIKDWNKHKMKIKMKRKYE